LIVVVVGVGADVVVVGAIVVEVDDVLEDVVDGFKVVEVVDEVEDDEVEDDEVEDDEVEDVLDDVLDDVLEDDEDGGGVAAASNAPMSTVDPFVRG